jgi:hypothetical protein
VHRTDKVFEFFVRAGWVNELEEELAAVAAETKKQ